MWLLSLNIACDSRSRPDPDFRTSRAASPLRRRHAGLVHHWRLYTVHRACLGKDPVCRASSAGTSPDQIIEMSMEKVEPTPTPTAATRTATPVACGNMDTPRSEALITPLSGTRSIGSVGHCLGVYSLARPVFWILPPPTQRYTLTARRGSDQDAYATSGTALQLFSRVKRCATSTLKIARHPPPTS